MEQRRCGVTTVYYDHRSYMEKGTVIYSGGCHCGAVRFEVKAPADLTVYDCSCSVCKKKHNIHFIVPNRHFKLLQGKESLTTYRFNTKKAQHLFCMICGVQSYYVPRSNPTGFGVNPDCLDQQPKSITIEKFDGENWEISYEKELEKDVPIQTRSQE